MNGEKCGIDGVFLYRLKGIPDSRGSFCEIFRKEWLPGDFSGELQVNCSVSGKGVIRGLHYHRNQTDFWVPLRGRLLAGLADLRRDSPTSGKCLSIELDGGEPSGLLIPPGVAHGFAVHSDMTMLYLVNRYYDSTDEYGVAWDDPRLTIEWGIEEPLLSQRDRNNQPFELI